MEKKRESQSEKFMAAEDDESQYGETQSSGYFEISGGNINRTAAYFK